MAVGPWYRILDTWRTTFFLECIPAPERALPSNAVPLGQQLEDLRRSSPHELLVSATQEHKRGRHLIQQLYSLVVLGRQHPLPDESVYRGCLFASAKQIDQRRLEHHDWARAGLLTNEGGSSRHLRIVLDRVLEALDRLGAQ